jgi:phycocyanobilin lyase subunit beta
MTNFQTLIQAVEQADSPVSLIAAVRALASAREEAGIPTLIAVLGYNNPGAALAAVDGLVQMGEAAVIPLLELLDEYNYGARAYAIRALAAIADPRALDVLLKAAATDFAPSVRRAAAKGLGNIRWHLLPNEQILPAQTKTLETLTQITADADWSIRYAAIVGLQSLAHKTSEIRPQILAQFEQISATETDQAVKARIQLASQSTAIRYATATPNALQAE